MQYAFSKKWMENKKGNWSIPFSSCTYIAMLQDGSAASGEVVDLHIYCQCTSSWAGSTRKESHKAGSFCYSKSNQRCSHMQELAWQVVLL